MESTKSNLTTDYRPLWALSVDDLRQIIREAVSVPIYGDVNDQNKYIYGLDGIRKEFGVGHNTAQRLKDTVLRDAVLQAGPGCKVIIDLELARKLYCAHKDKGGK